jgi:hypothetical protein
MRAPELSNEKNFRIYPGGWHWSTVGSPGNLTYEERVYKKIKTTSHSNELMVDNLMDTIKKRISENILKENINEIFRLLALYIILYLLNLYLFI